MREALLHAFLARHNEEDWSTEKRYSDNPSTKIDAIMVIILYHLDAPARPPLHVVGKEGEPNTLMPNAQYLAGGDDEANTDGVTDTVPNTPDLIVLYLAFPKNNWIVKKASAQRTQLVYAGANSKQALEEENIEYAELTGSKTPQSRTAALARFRDDPKCNVLILSGVGMVGLNIAFANILIIAVRKLIHIDGLGSSRYRTHSGQPKKTRN